VTPDWNTFSRWTSAWQEHCDDVERHAHSALRAEVNWVLRRRGIHACAEVQLGKTSQAVGRATVAREPNVVVIGARGEHELRISPAALGGTVLKLSLQTQCPLLLVRGWDLGPYTVSMAAVHEASELSRRIVFWATALAQAGECHIFHAYEVPYVERMRLCGVDQAELASCALATEKAARLGIEGILASAVPKERINVDVGQGGPLGGLVTETAVYAPQLVVVGKQEPGLAHSPSERLGSLCLRMAYHTPVDVLVVP
jgi:nucleotide-binding universal stress UspA family protein